MATGYKDCERRKVLVIYYDVAVLKAHMGEGGGVEEAKNTYEI